MDSSVRFYPLATSEDIMRAWINSPEDKRNQAITAAKVKAAQVKGGAATPGKK
jgi:hypothetical protein